MPKYKVTDPENGKSLLLEGDSTPNEQEIESAFRSVAQASVGFKEGPDTATIKTPRQPGDSSSTTTGGPRVPVASLAETMVEPIEQAGEVATEKGVPFTQIIPDVKPDDSRAMAVGKEAAKIALSIPEFATSSLGIGSMAAAKVPPMAVGKKAAKIASSLGIGSMAAAKVPPIVVAGAFTADMMKSLGNQILESHNNWDKMTPAQHYAAVTDMVGTGTMGLLLARGTGESIRSSRSATLKPKTVADKIKPVAPLTAEAVKATEKGPDASNAVKADESQVNDAPVAPSDAGNAKVDVKPADEVSPSETPKPEPPKEQSEVAADATPEAPRAVETPAPVDTPEARKARGDIPILGVELADGEVISDPSARFHSDVLEKRGIPESEWGKVKSTGFFVNGKYSPFGKTPKPKTIEVTPNPAEPAPAPAAPAQKMEGEVGPGTGEGPGTPKGTQGADTSAGGFQDQSGADIYGIAARVREQRAKAGQVAPIASGQGVAPKEAVSWGQALIKMGVNPEKSMQEFERTRAVSFDLMAVARGYGEMLAETARSIEGKFGTDSNEYRMAKKALTDWDTRSKAMQTEWHKIGMAQQGETDIDTGTFTGINRAYHEATGKDLSPAQEKTAKKLAKDVSDADKRVEAAKAALDKSIESIGDPVEPHIQRLADKIIAAMDKKANDALARIRARQAEGRAFSIADPEDLDDVAIYGAAKITKGVVEFGKWSAEMVKDIGEGIKPHLQKVFDAAKKYEDDQTSKLAGSPAVQEKVRMATKGIKAPETIADQRKAFTEHEDGEPLTPLQQKTILKRAKEYINKGEDDKAEIVYKVAQDLGIPTEDVLRGLAQTGKVKRIADDVWQKQRQARILKQSAKRWIETANDSWLQKTIPNVARAVFTAKTFGHGTVAIGTHAALEAAAHPVITAQNFGKMYKLVLSREYYEMQGRELSRRPNYTVAQRAGLVNDMAKMEDFNDPKLALGFPKMAEWFRQNLDKVKMGGIVGAGTRGYSVLKILRQDLFDHEWNKLSDSEKFEADGKTLHANGQEMAKAIADSVNHMTGVVKTSVPSAANFALFAPKLALSRLSVIAGDPVRAVNSMLQMRNMTPAEKWFATNQFKEKAKIFAVASSLLMANQQLNNLFGDKKKLNGIPEALGGGGWNPMDSDFMKFRVAGMNVAWGSPFLTMTRLPLRIYQIGKGDGGKTKFLIYPDESMYKTVGSYLRTQESPFLAPIVDLVTKADYADRPLPKIPGYGPPPPVPKRLKAQGVKAYTWKEFASEVILPIPFEEGAKEIFHSMNTPGHQDNAWVKPFVTIVGMAATGGRISDDWKKTP